MHMIGRNMPLQNVHPLPGILRVPPPELVPLPPRNTLWRYLVIHTNGDGWKDGM